MLTVALVRVSSTTFSCQAVGAQAFTLTAATAPFVGHYADTFGVVGAVGRIEQVGVTIP
ncbi:hypothetical protein [Arthrobacter sp. A5]|uniref:hypothetical protein n=1 Tax=Arthrobacter sp. A5 TaxID=576926 RepID=UPI003DA8B670